MIREKYKKAQAEQDRELEQERKLMIHDKIEYIYGSNSDPRLKQRSEKTSKLLSS
jgi:hypothetical protein